MTTTVTVTNCSNNWNDSGNRNVIDERLTTDRVARRLRVVVMA